MLTQLIQYSPIHRYRVHPWEMKEGSYEASMDIMRDGRMRIYRVPKESFHWVICQADHERIFLEDSDLQGSQEPPSWVPQQAVSDGGWQDFLDARREAMEEAQKCHDNNLIEIAAGKEPICPIFQNPTYVEKFQPGNWIIKELGEGQRLDNIEFRRGALLRRQEDIMKEISRLGLQEPGEEAKRSMVKQVKTMKDTIPRPPTQPESNEPDIQAQYLAATTAHKNCVKIVSKARGEGARYLRARQQQDTGRWDTYTPHSWGSATTICHPQGKPHYHTPLPSIR